MKMSKRGCLVVIMEVWGSVGGCFWGCFWDHFWDHFWHFDELGFLRPKMSNLTIMTTLVGS
jgi:hypothetical protein